MPELVRKGRAAMSRQQDRSPGPSRWAVSLALGLAAALGAVAAAAGEPATSPAWAAHAVGDVKMQIPAAWKPLYKSADGAGWYVGDEQSPHASFTVVREQTVSGYTSGLQILHRRNISVTGHPAIFYDAISRDRKVRLWLLLTKERMSDGRRLAFVAASPNNLWAQYDASYRKILQSIAIPGGKDQGPQIATTFPLDEARKALWVPVSAGQVTLRVPATWRKMSGAPQGEGGWYVGKVASPQASLSIVREKDFAAYTKDLVVRQKARTLVTGHPAAFFDCASRSGTYTLWILTLDEPAADGRRVGFVAAAPTDSWKKHQADVKRALQSVQIPGGKAKGPQIATAPPWQEAKPKPEPPPLPDVKKPVPEPPPPPPPPPPPDVKKPKPEPPQSRPALRERMRRLLPPLLQKLLRRPEPQPPEPPPPPTKPDTRPATQPAVTIAGRKVYLCVEKWPNGQVRRQYTYYVGSEFRAGMQWVGNAPEEHGQGYKILHGSYRRCRDDGKPEYEAEFRDGLPDGPTKGWWPDGTKQFEAVYKTGKLDEGTWKVWDRTGKPSTSQATGVYP